MTGLSTLRTTGLGSCANATVASRVMSKQAGNRKARVYLSLFVEALPRTRERATSRQILNRAFAIPERSRIRRAVSRTECADANMRRAKRDKETVVWLNQYQRVRKKRQYRGGYQVAGKNARAEIAKS